VTYPRTDSKYISNDIIPTLKDRINTAGNPELSDAVDYIKKLKDYNLSKRYVDDTKVSDHHAIIPTEQAARLNSLSPDEKKVYDIIIKRFLAIFLPPYEYTIKSIITDVEGESFISKGKTVQDLGWMSLYKNEKDKKEDENKADEQKLPQCSTGDKLNVQNVKIDEKQTKAPPLYTEGTLLSAMENAGRFVEDEELKEQLKDSGLGTPATRAAIIERLIKVGYITREKKSLIPTEKGINLISIVPDEIKSPELTGKWEKALSLMAKGQYSTEKFMKSIINYSNFLIGESQKGKSVEFARDIKSKYPVGKCPVCGASVIETSKGWSCSKWKSSGCKFTIWKDDKGLSYFNKKVTASMVKALLKNRRAPVKGLTNPKTSQKFDKDVILVQENGYWNIKVDFTDSANTGLSPDSASETKVKGNPPVVTEHVCPSCKTGHLMHVGNDKFKGWSCEKWREGCKFSVPEEKCGIRLEAYLSQLVNNGETDFIEGFKSQKGNTFSAKLVVKDGKLEMVFGNTPQSNTSSS
jgi:DNA topoisomerase-3